MNRTLIILIFIAMRSIASAEEGSLLTTGFISPDVTRKTNIHNNEKYCAECHKKIPVSNGEKFLRHQDYTLTCRCHGYSSEKYRHPLGTSLSPEKKGTIPPDFPLENGKITCITCHDIVMQCEIMQDQSRKTINFLRIDSSQSRTAICYGCHDEAGYERLNPHKQFDDEGNIIKSKCRYCHKFKPDEKSATLKKQRAGATGTVEFVAEFFTLCFRCHYKQTAAHLINANHLTREPPAEILMNIQISEKELGIILPLDDEGGLTCATCHNPHQRGIIPFSSPAASGADEDKRLRVPRAGNRICRACHLNH